MGKRGRGVEMGEGKEREGDKVRKRKLSVSHRFLCVWQSA